MISPKNDHIKYVPRIHQIKLKARWADSYIFQCGHWFDYDYVHGSDPWSPARGQCSNESPFMEKRKTWAQTVPHRAIIVLEVTLPSFCYMNTVTIDTSKEKREMSLYKK